MAQILVVDDEKSVVDLIRTTLELGGHKVHDVGDGAQALDLLGVEPSRPVAYMPELIIMDIAMPVLDGYTATSRLYDDAVTKAIPVVVISAKSKMRENLELLPNVKAFIEKPFDTAYLAKLVERLTKKVP